MIPSEPPVALSPLQRDQLIMRYVPLVRHAVGAYTFTPPTSLDAEDIYSYGTMGLIDAIDRFDASRGVKFETYAVTRIRGYLIDQLRALDWLPRSARAHVRTVQRTTARIEEQFGHRPGCVELAEATGLSQATCEQAMADSSCQTLSLDSLTASDEENGPLSLLQRLEDHNSPNPALTTEREEMRRAVAGALAGLPEREREILRLRYEQNWTLKQVAGMLGVSESRASQLHSQALNRVRRALKANFEDLERLSA